jgi:hypothetical protein
MAASLGPKIITNSLSLALDAADKNSYPGSGTTWTDLSGNQNHGTLANGPTFNGSNGGSIVFDGVDDYINLNGGAAINNWNPDGVNSALSYRSYTSANIWFKTSTISTGGVSRMIFSDTLFEYGFSHADGTLTFSATAASKTTTISANTWYNACLTADVGRVPTGTYTQSGTTTVTFATTYPVSFSTSDTVYISVGSGSGTLPSGNYVVTVTGASAFTVTAASSATTSGNFYYIHSSNSNTLTAYLNGVQIGSPSTANNNNGLNDAPFNLGRDPNGGATYFTGNIAIFQLYSKILTPTEVLQNFNAEIRRFGL